MKYEDERLVDFDAQQFDPNLLYSKEAFSTAEYEYIAATLNIFKEYYPEPSSKLSEILYAFHASANLVTSVHTLHSESLVSVDIELLRIVDLVTDCIDAVLTDSFSSQSLEQQIVRRILFHAGVQQGRLFPLHLLPVQKSYRQLQELGGSQQQFVANLLFVLCHETAHLDPVRDSDTSDFVRNHFSSAEASAHFKNAILMGLDPVEFVRSLRRDHQIEWYVEPFQELSRRSDSWRSELYCDFLGIALVIGVRRKIELGFSHAIAGLLGLQFTQLILEITGLLLNEPDHMTRATANTIIKATERVLALISSVSTLVILQLHQSQHKAGLETLQRIALGNYQLAQRVLTKIQSLIETIRNHSVGDIASSRRIASEWGYSSSRVGKIFWGGRLKNLNKLDGAEKLNALTGDI